MSMVSKRVSAIVLLVLLMMMFVVPVASYATSDPATTKRGDIFDDFSVKLGEDGKLVTSGQEGGSVKAWQTLLDKYKAFIVGIAGIGAVTMVVLFILQFIKLGTTAGQPSERSKALAGVLWTGIAAAGLGAVAVITGIFYNAI